MLEGLDFLEHKVVINEKIEILKREKTNVLLREYQEDFYRQHYDGNNSGWCYGCFIVNQISMQALME